MTRVITKSPGLITHSSVELPTSDNITFSQLTITHPDHLQLINTSNKVQFIQRRKLKNKTNKNCDMLWMKSGFFTLTANSFHADLWKQRLKNILN